MDPIRLLTVLYVIATPIIAGLATLEFRIGGFNYTGYVWATMLPIGLGLLALNRMSKSHQRVISLFWPWLVWCGFVCLSLLWCKEVTGRNIQDALQLCMPLVVGLVAASAIRSRAELRWIFFAFGVSLVLLAAFTLAFVTESFDREWMSTNVRAAALSTTLVGCVFLAAFPRRIWLPIVGWTACLVMTTLTSSRIAAFALLAVPVLHPCLRGRLLTKSLAVAGLAGLGLVLFYTPAFQEHFFLSGGGTIGDLVVGDYSDLGRFDAWSAVWDEAWRRPWIGAGVGSAYTFVPQVWDDMYQVHNDYLRIFYEQGIVGLAVFLAVSSWQLLSLRRQVAATDGIVRTTLTAAWLGFCALLISCLTDNTLVYNLLYTDPLFVLLGAGYGVALAELRTGSQTTLQPAAPVDDWRQQFTHRNRGRDQGRASAHLSPSVPPHVLSRRITSPIDQNHR